MIPSLSVLHTVPSQRRNEVLDELDTLFVAQQRPAGRIQIRPPVGRAALERLRRRGVGVAGVHLALERLELVKREVTGTAQRRGRCRARAGGVEYGWREGDRALFGKVRDEDVGRRVQVALVVAADERSIAGEGHVALQDTGTHARARLVALLGVLGELQRPATAVADEIGRASCRERVEIWVVA